MNRDLRTLDIASPNSHDRATNGARKAKSGVAKRQENVHLEGVSDVDALLSPIWTLEDSRKTLKELFYEGRSVQRRMSGSERRSHRRKRKVMKGFVFGKGA